MITKSLLISLSGLRHYPSVSKIWSFHWKNWLDWQPGSLLHPLAGDGYQIHHTGIHCKNDNGSVDFSNMFATSKDYVMHLLLILKIISLIFCLTMTWTSQLNTHHF